MRRSLARFSKLSVSGEKASPLGSRIPLAALIQALAVAEYLNFRHAANALGICQSSVSARIKSLEDDLGILLFERHARGVRLTEAGRHFIEKIAAGIDQLDHAVRTAGMVGRGEKGCIRIGLHSPLDPGFLTDLLTRHRTNRPDVHIEIAESRACENIRLIREGGLDVAFIAGQPSAPDCHSRVLWTEAMVVAAPADHAVVQRDCVTWADLSAEVFIVRYGGDGPLTHDHIVRRLSEMGCHPQLRRLNVGRDTLLQMVAQGYGVTLATEAAVLASVPGVAFKPIADEPQPVRFNAVWSPHNQSQTLRDFLDLASRMSRSCLPD